MNICLTHATVLNFLLPSGSNSPTSLASRSKHNDLATMSRIALFPVYDNGCVNLRMLTEVTKCFQIENDNTCQVSNLVILDHR